MRPGCGDGPRHDNHVVMVVDEAAGWISEMRPANDLTRTAFAADTAWDSSVAIADESTWNGCQLVDGLMAAGCDARLANAAAVQHYGGLRHASGEHDGHPPARLLPGNNKLAVVIVCPPHYPGDWRRTKKKGGSKPALRGYRSRAAQL